MGMAEQLAATLGNKVSTTSSSGSDVPTASSTLDTRQLPEIANNGSIMLQSFSKLIETLEQLKVSWGSP
jgi:hypothetical protein